MFDDILQQNPEELSGRDLLMFNLAFHVSQHEIDWDNATISEIVSSFEKDLDRVEEDQEDARS